MSIGSLSPTSPDLNTQWCGSRLYWLQKGITALKTLFFFFHQLLGNITVCVPEPQESPSWSSGLPPSSFLSRLLRDSAQETRPWEGKGHPFLPRVALLDVSCPSVIDSGNIPCLNRRLAFASRHLQWDKQSPQNSGDPHSPWRQQEGPASS